jgi:hypothetical protein
MARPITLAPPRDGRSLVQFKTRIPLDVKAALAAKAISEGRTITEETTRALRAYVNA